MVSKHSGQVFVAKTDERSGKEVGIKGDEDSFNLQKEIYRIACEVRWRKCRYLIIAMKV